MINGPGTNSVTLALGPSERLTGRNCSVGVASGMLLSTPRSRNVC